MQSEANMPSFSSAEYGDICPYFGLNSAFQGRDIKEHDLSHIYIPQKVFVRVLFSISLYQSQYGSIRDMFNETYVRISCLQYVLRRLS